MASYSESKIFTIGKDTCAYMHVYDIYYISVEYFLDSDFSSL